MKVVKLSDGLVLIPNSKLQTLSLWFLSFFTKGYEKTHNPEAYPIGRRLKINF